MKINVTKFLRLLCASQGLYFFITGVWPLIHISSFVAISGPKIDLWLVKTVGAVLAVIGLVLGSAAFHKRINWETFLLAVCAAFSLACIDIYYVLINRIWDIYLLDALVEIIFIVLWIFAFRLKKMA